jgi:circadian clock protein KaiB
MKRTPGLNGGAANGLKARNIFKLYITGASPNSSRAISNLKSFFEKYLKNKYELQIIDVYQQPQIARTVDIIALPLLVRKEPLPERRLIGDMSNDEKIMKSLGIENTGK